MMAGHVACIIEYGAEACAPHPWALPIAVIVYSGLALLVVILSCRKQNP